MDGRTIVMVVMGVLFVRWYMCCIEGEISRWLGKSKG